MTRPEFKQYEYVFFNGVRSQIVAVNPTSKTFNVRSANSLAQGIEASQLFATYDDWKAANPDDPTVKPVDLLAWHKPPVAPRPAPAPKLAVNPNPPPKAVQGDQFIAPMSKIEAQSLVNQIRSSMNSVADKLLQLKERDGWKALGYANWRDCVTAEFDLSQTRVYQLLAYAEVQQNISTIGGKTPIEINERQARELAKAPADQQAPILDKALETAPAGKLTAQHIKRTVETEISTIVETKIDYIDPETGEILDKPIPVVDHVEIVPQMEAVAPAVSEETAPTIPDETDPETTDDPLEDLLLEFPFEWFDELKAILQCAWDRQVGLSGLIDLVKDVASRPIEFDFSEPHS